MPSTTRTRKPTPAAIVLTPEQLEARNLAERLHPGRVFTYQHDEFANAKAGDAVAIPYEGGDVKRVTIDRLTPTQVIVGDRRYRRDNGRAVGDRRDNGRAVGEERGFITQWTDEHATQAARYEAGKRLGEAVRALGQVATGWGVKIPKDHVAANALSEAIEAYLKGAS